LARFPRAGGESGKPAFGFPLSPWARHFHRPWLAQKMRGGIGDSDLHRRNNLTLAALIFRAHSVSLITPETQNFPSHAADLSVCIAASPVRGDIGLPGGLLRCPPETGPHQLPGCFPFSGMPSLLPLHKPDQSRTPSLQRVVLHAFTGTTRSAFPQVVDLHWESDWPCSRLRRRHQTDPSQPSTTRIRRRC
jgi:hypothetical protein